MITAIGILGASQGRFHIFTITPAAACSAVPELTSVRDGGHSTVSVLRATSGDLLWSGKWVE